MQAKGIVYYTDNILNKSFAKTIRNVLKRSAGDIPIVWVSQKTIDETNNIVCGGIGRSHKSMCFQILTGIQAMFAENIYFAEHDVIYHPSHFEFVPPRDDVFYYNRNRWWLDSKTGQASFSQKCFAALSQLAAKKSLLESHYIERVEAYMAGINVRKHHGTEPGKHKGAILKNYEIGEFFSDWPNIDIRHGRNFTKSDRFKEKYELEDGIPFWGKTKGRYKEFMDGL